MSSNDEPKGRKVDSTIVGAIITGVVTIVVTVIGVFGPRLAAPPSPPTETPLATPFPIWTIVPTGTITDTPVPTTTVETGEPTSTPAPDTPTPVPSATREPPEIGEDWANDCISARWQAVPATDQTPQEDGCLQLPVGDFNISNSRLTFLVNRRFDGGEFHGLFAPLSAEGTVRLKTHLDIVGKGEVWMGVFAEPSTDSAGVVMYIPAGDITQRPLVKLTLPENSKNQSKPYTRTDATYDVKFTYTVGTVAVSAMSGSFVFNAIPVASNQKWLFVGYRSANGNNAIGASFFDLAFE